MLAHAMPIQVPNTVAALFVEEFTSDAPRVALPHAEPYIVVRFGAARGGFDVHVMGARQRAHRKLIRAGQRAVFARLRLGAQERVLGVAPSELAGRVVALEELWGRAGVDVLNQQLADARDLSEAASLLERAIAARTSPRARHPQARLALEAAARLAHGNVSAVALELGLSERHLRRVFRDEVGMSPKAFGRLARFQRALRAARAQAAHDWAAIAVETGYYDQAHLIAEFREISGATPRALLRELGLEATR